MLSDLVSLDFSENDIGDVGVSCLSVLMEQLSSLIKLVRAVQTVSLLVLPQSDLVFDAVFKYFEFYSQSELVSALNGKRR